MARGCVAEDPVDTRHVDGSQLASHADIRRDAAGNMDVMTDAWAPGETPATG